MPRLKSAIAGVLTALLVVQTTGCTSWKVASQPWPTTVGAHPNRRVQVTLADGQILVADSAVASAETLVTYQPGKVDTIPLAQIRVVKVRQPNALKTVGLVLGVAAGAFAAFVVGVVIYCSATACFD